MSRRRSRRRRGPWAVVAMVCALGASAGLVWSASGAAFNATTGDGSNTVTSGTVVLSDGDSGSALFTSPGLAPGASVQRCITVRYDGSLPGVVRMYASPSPGALAPYLAVTLDEGTGGTGSSCAGFVRDVTSVNAMALSTVSATFTGHGNGTGSWPVTGPGQERRYRITTTLDPALPNSAGGAAASASLTWQVRDTSDPTSERYRDTVLADGPAHYYRLGETGTAAVDQTGGPSGTHQGTTRTTAPGIVGSVDRAQGLNGTDQYVQLPTLTTDFSAGLTIEAWMKFATVTPFARIVDLGNGQVSNNITLTREGTTPRFQFSVLRGSSQQLLITGSVLQTGVWQHVVVTQTAAGASVIYVDGEPVVSGNVHLPLVVTRTSNFIGRSNWTGESLAQGSVDDVAFYTKALTPTQVRAHFRAGR